MVKIIDPAFARLWGMQMTVKDTEHQLLLGIIIRSTHIQGGIEWLTNTLLILFRWLRSGMIIVENKLP